MLETIAPTPIVQQARVELPGLKALVSELKPLYLAARSNSALAHLSAWRVMVRIHAYAERPEVKAEVDRLNLRLDGKCRQGGQLTAFRLVIKDLAEGGPAGPDGQKMFECHGGTRTSGACPESRRTAFRWKAEWSRVAPIIGCRSLAHLLGLTRFEQESAGAPGGLTVAIENALKKARESIVLLAEAAPATTPELNSLGRRYAQAFARRLAARGGDGLVQTKGGVVELLRGLETGFRKSGLTRLAGLLAAASAQAEKEGSDEPGTPAAG